MNTHGDCGQPLLPALSPVPMKPGDVYVTNDPWLGTGHLFDYVMMTPVFLGKKLVAFFASTLPRD